MFARRRRGGCHVPATSQRWGPCPRVQRKSPSAAQKSVRNNQLKNLLKSVHHVTPMQNQNHPQPAQSDQLQGRAVWLRDMRKKTNTEKAHSCNLCVASKLCCLLCHPHYNIKLLISLIIHFLICLSPALAQPLLASFHTRKCNRNSYCRL